MPISRLVQSCASSLPFMVVLSLSAAVAPAFAQTTPVTINSSVTIVESAQEPGPIHRATEDLRHDFAKVFGQQPKLVSSLSDAGKVTILIAQNQNAPAEAGCAAASGTEAFAFSAANSGGEHVVCLTGTDMRGTIFAIYEFSQHILGVDPMYLWTEKQPTRHASIALPADFARSYPSPV